MTNKERKELLVEKHNQFAEGISRARQQIETFERERLMVLGQIQLLDAMEKEEVQEAKKNECPIDDKKEE